MKTRQKVLYRIAQKQEYPVIAEHFYQMWLDNQVAADALQSNWQEITLKFLDKAQQELQYKAFFAELEGQIIGSASCQLFAGLYPLVFKSEYRQYGYIWGVYVQPDYRRQGIARQLTHLATQHLKSIGCTRVVLNASPFGKSLYTQLGFVDSNLMQLDLI